MNNQKIKLVAIALGILVCSICYGLNTNHKSSKLIDISMKEQTASSEQEVLTDPSLEQESKTASIYYVHICGEVNSPGVYELEEGSRVFSAVEKAGGFTENAATDSLNLAEAIKDGMKIEVMDQEEAKRREDQGMPQNGDSPEGSHQVNLNTAGKEELMKLRGIGEAKAEDIIRYRDSHGGFKKIEDIMKISGIKEAAFEKIKDNITV